MLLTGLYSHRINIPDYIPHHNPVYVDNGLPAGTPTIASVLREAGYVTGLVGKWHLGYGEKYYPKHFGFDYAEGYPHLPHDNNGMKAWEIPTIINGEQVNRFRNDPQHTDILADLAIDFIRAQSQKPFFLFLSIYMPHQPWYAIPDTDRVQYQNQALTVPDQSSFPDINVSNEKLQDLTRQYYSCITCADRNIGRVLNTLDDQGIADETIVIFIGDNGFMVGQHGLLGKGNAAFLSVDNLGKVNRDLGRRPNMFDESVLVPFIIRWPGVVQPGTTNNALVSTIDILPTLMNITGLSDSDLQVDGSSLYPMLQGKTNNTWRTAYCDTYDMINNGNDGEKPYMRMIRTDDWKLILYQDENGQPLDNGNRHELFNLKADPNELNNLYGLEFYSKAQDKLAAQLYEWMDESEVEKSH